MPSAAKTRTPWKRVNNTSPAKDKLWQSMRIMRTFSAPELAAVSEVHVTTADKYVRALHNAGFLRRVAEHKPGQPGTSDTYTLVRNTGPLSPIRHKKGGVYDRNSDIRWSTYGKAVVTDQEGAGA